MSDFDAFLESANAEFDSVATKGTNPEFARTRFTCESCGGSGLWRGGRVNQHGNAKCNTCHGQGFLMTSPEARAKGRVRAVAARRNRAEVAREQNAEHGNGFLLKWLGENAHWNTFAASLMDQHNAGRAWSDRQVESCRAMYAKIKANQAAREAERQAAMESAAQIDLGPIIAMFDTARASGYKRPTYRANDLRIKPGRNGALYVLTELRTEYGQYGEQPGYEGKIADGRFIPARACADDTATKLQVIAADPRGEAIRFGQRTGTCSCCGRELTKHASIEAGIGPICAQKWGLA